jgi:predicted esterase YcpF (UPF0227 family)
VRVEAVTADEKERIRALEVKVDYLTETIEKMADTVDQLNAVMQQARGARWAILGVAGLAGFLAAKLSPFTAWLIGVR